MANATAANRYTVDADAEPLNRYRVGGYHPTHIGDRFREGRYQVLHKLGWGGYSTVWLTNDLQESRLVSLKILVAEISDSTQQIDILQRVAHPSAHPGSRHICPLLDLFRHEGPNGSHQCLVFNLETISVQNLVSRMTYERLPGRAAWKIARQTALALDYLHREGVAHGDLHTGNIMVSRARDKMSDAVLLEQLEQPHRGMVQALPGFQLTKNVPDYLVEPVFLPLNQNSEQPRATMIDFGQAFFHDRPAKEIRTPLVFRAPELLLDSKWGHQIDIWALGCTLFELVTGQPPFDNLMPDKASLIQEWIATFGDLPTEWRPKSVNGGSDGIDRMSITDWLHECYFQEDRQPDFAEEHLEWFGDLLTGMMRYRPEDRMTTDQILSHRWFERNPFKL